MCDSMILEKTRYFDFVEEMVSLMNQTRREEKQYSLEELHTMVANMVDDFEIEALFHNQSIKFEMNFDLNQPLVVWSSQMSTIVRSSEQLLRYLDTTLKTQNLRICPKF